MEQFSLTALLTLVFFRASLLFSCNYHVSHSDIPTLVFFVFCCCFLWQFAVFNLCLLCLIYQHVQPLTSGSDPISQSVMSSLRFYLFQCSVLNCFVCLVCQHVQPLVSSTYHISRLNMLTIVSFFHVSYFLLRHAYPSFLFVPFCYFHLMSCFSCLSAWPASSFLHGSHFPLNYAYSSVLFVPVCRFLLIFINRCISDLI